MQEKMVYFFGNGVSEGDASMRNLLGGKGANLAEMVSLGIPVPAGFTITTEVCTAYYANNKTWPANLEAQVREALAKVEEAMGAKFGDPENPLLLSVRSGARVSMPGMMDTILNLGINDEVAEGLAKRTNNPRFAYDSYRRFIQMYGDVVLGVDHDKFEEQLEAQKKKAGVQLDSDLEAEDLKELVERYKQLVEKEIGKGFPVDPWEQLVGAINAVFDSWNTPRAVTYRRLNDIPHDWGTAVNVQAMVFGNMGPTSGTGVAFTRTPSTGENKFYGEYLFNAQGEDVVAGIRTPQPIETLKDAMPEVYEELVSIYKKLEAHYKDMQDVEFTIQDGKLYMLQTRAGKRTAAAALRIAVEMVEEGLIDKKTAVTRVDPNQLDQLLHPRFDEEAVKKAQVIAKGLPASPGAAVGRVVFFAEDAEKWAERGEKVILVRNETSPEDIGGMHSAQGILTARGGMTSHAAVVARGMGKCCVAGAGAIRIDYEARQFTVGDVVVKEGDWISIDGTAGTVMLGQVATVQPELTGNFATIMEWADEFRAMKVRTNADTPQDARIARQFGAEGIGLCRTEHMFFADDRIGAVREMILADNEESRRKALAKLLPFQRGDFYEIFKEMSGLPVTIRLLDPPLHEFLPQDDAAIAQLAKDLGVSEKEVRDRVEALHELNPMLGHRGCRLGITYPEIYEMQVQAIMEAACQLAKEGQKVVPEIMIPLVGTVRELEILKQVAVETAERVMKEAGVAVEYSVGTMIEVPRAALTADEIAREAEFFSFGTNDMTQMTYGFSRDDIGTFLPDYLEQNILEKDPFQSIDQKGVGQLVKIGTEKGRATRPDLKVGVCGEHGGDPSSVVFFHNVGLDYVSCSPFRVPAARLAAAQANIANPR
ncbi:MAG: pyruvate, phosphate dikinase [Firmicutes bacterium]|nr:pyruvate, phosphate dikinase [Bacillota bacterium]